MVVFGLYYSSKDEGAYFASNAVRQVVEGLDFKCLSLPDNYLGSGKFKVKILEGDNLKHGALCTQFVSLYFSFMGLYKVFNGLNL